MASRRFVSDSPRITHVGEYSSPATQGFTISKAGEKVRRACRSGPARSSAFRRDARHDIEAPLSKFRAAIVTAIVGVASVRQQRIGPTHKLYVASPRPYRRMRIQVGWIAVEEAEIELIGHLRIVPHSPVVVAIEPFLRQRIRQLQSFRDLERRQPRLAR